MAEMLLMDKGPFAVKVFPLQVDKKRSAVNTLATAGSIKLNLSAHHQAWTGGGACETSSGTIWRC